MNKDNSGPAFPAPSYDDEGEVSYEFGMSLRDYFAGQALAGFCAKGNACSSEVYARAAYLVADKMLEEREK